jgi:chromosomal replication initiation ATPase DnaA
MNTEETDYFERYLTYRKKHTNLFKKHQSTIAKYEKEISRLKHLLTKPIGKEKEDVKLTMILEAVCSTTEIIPHDILAQNRQRTISIARHLFCYIAYKHYGYCLTAIGRFLNKNHSTIIHSITTYQNYLDCNYKLETKYYAQTKGILSIGAE